ncbi:S66 peptidase family protein [Halomonas cerina]|uniref:Muramoyltetrapeptide carboxypeptidase n=1 Tax=Halomonas cerina TaxID=447424 RepID=A0A839V9R6_9GAMM|nr:LD-carboxypeptidase [Halomonas cerina]MBB3190700.1 muramoyltetrapeptide carboxypeptidase [Halomonas cerina]
MPLAVSLIAPSSFTAPEAVADGIRGLASLGVAVHFDEPLQAPDRYLAASRERRLAQWHAAYDDPETQAVWAVRGGFGAAQLVDGIDWARLARRPKPLIGYSDVTVLLDQCHRHGLPALHGPVAKAAGGLLEGDDTRRAVIHRQFEETLALISGPAPLDYPLTPHRDTPPTLTGPVVGGNLTTLASLVGTPMAFSAPRGALVILEDVGEPYYRLERALWQLVHGGALNAAAAVCLGTFEGCTPYGETPLEVIVAETLAPLGLPLFSGLPIGHGLHNRPWRYGATGCIANGRLRIPR